MYPIFSLQRDFSVRLMLEKSITTIETIDQIYGKKSTAYSSTYIH